MRMYTSACVGFFAGKCEYAHMSAQMMLMYFRIDESSQVFSLKTFVQYNTFLNDIALFTL